MELSPHSKNHLLGTFAHWDVPKDYADPMYNYLVHGFSPGSFFTALLANDAIRMLSSSHPANTIPALKNLSGWISSHLVESNTFGSYEVVERWLYHTSEQDRRKELESLRLIFPEKTEIIKILRDEPTHEPHLWPNQW